MLIGCNSLFLNETEHGHRITKLLGNQITQVEDDLRSTNFRYLLQSFVLGMKAWCLFIRAIEYIMMWQGLGFKA